MKGYYAASADRYNPTRRQRGGYPNVGTVLSLFLAFVGVAGSFQSAYALSINLNTPALAGTDGRLEFNILDGDLTDNNSATISTLNTDGTLQGTDCTLTSNCTGGPPYTISDIGGFGQFIQDLTLGTSVLIDLSFTKNFAGGDPDLLVLNLLDPGTNLTLVDTDLDALSAPVPYQDALLVINLADGTILLPTRTDPSLGVQVPEPGTLALMLLGAPLFLRRSTRLRENFRGILPAFVS